VPYVFKGWYDVAFDHNTGFETMKVEDIVSTRTRSMVYYAHYETTLKYQLKIVDRTQAKAFEGVAGFESGYAVAENTVWYNLPAGTLFDSSAMLFKGLIDTSDRITPAQFLYEDYMKIQYIQGAFMVEYNRILDGRTYAVAKAALITQIEILDAEIRTHERLLAALYSYNYDGWDETLFRSYAFGQGTYDAKRLELFTLRKELAHIMSKSETENNMDDTLTALLQGTYIKYSDSAYDMNRAWDPLNTGKIRYEFVGWYTDSDYLHPYASNGIDFTWLVTGGDLTLYAKWADREKGTEGLVFEKVVIGGQIKMVVVDFLTRDEYIASKYFDCGYNNLLTEIYSINLNDDEEMPISVGANTQLQIPTYHGYTEAGGIKVQFPVIGIASGAFLNHAEKITSVALTATLEFIEDGAFLNCIKLRTVTCPSDTVYVTVDLERAVYQTIAFTAQTGESGREFSSEAFTLVVYASASASTSYATLSTTRFIGTGAFMGALLTDVALNENLIKIGASAFDGAKLSGTLSLPSTLQVLERDAFKSCGGVTTVEINGASNLVRVHASSLNTTAWFTRQAGAVVTLGGVIIGVRGGNENLFVNQTPTTAEIGNASTNAILYYTRAGAGASWSFTKIFINAETEDNEKFRGIADEAFKGCDAITIEFADASYLKFIGDFAFAGCLRLTEVLLRDYGFSELGAVGIEIFAAAGADITVYVPSIIALDQSWGPYLNVSGTHIEEFN